MFSRMIATVVLSIAIVSPAALAENLKDSRFFGVWGSEVVVSAACSAAAFPDHAQDTLAKIDANGISFVESGCRLSSIKQGQDDRTYMITLACSGEGLDWKAIEVWSLAEIGRDRFLTIASLAPKLESRVYRRCK